MNHQAWDEVEPWVWLNYIRGLGLKRLKVLLQRIGEPSAILSSSLQQLKELIPESVASNIRNCFADKLTVKHVMTAKKWSTSTENNWIISCTSSYYPKLLNNISDPPPILFVKGNIDCIKEPQVAIVGSRLASITSINHAYNFGKQLVNYGLTVTSGLALGVDGAAHAGAISSGGSFSTIAVVGTGIDKVYPSRHTALASKIIEHGAIISEFSLGTEPRPGNFPKRNRVISGLCLGVLVVEAKTKSGSLITAHQACDQGREVFAIPGDINNPAMKGCHTLIRGGAALVENPKQILMELQPSLKRMFAFPEITPEDSSQVKKITLNSNESAKDKILLQTLGCDVVPHEELVLRTGFSSKVVADILFNLEMDGKVSFVPGGVSQIFKNYSL